MNSEEKTILSSGLFLTFIYILLGAFFPQYDWDIASWMALRQIPLSLNFYDPVIAHSIFPGVLVGLIANNISIDLLFLHILLSCIFTGLGITVFMLLCYRITGKVIASITIGIIFAITRTSLIISLTGENDLFSIAIISFVLFYLYNIISEHKITGISKTKYYIIFSFICAWLTIFHLQLMVIGIVLPGITIFSLEFYFKNKTLNKEQLVLFFISYASYMAGLIISFSLMSIFMGYDPFTINLLTKFFDLNFATASSFSQNPNWSYLASGRTPFQQFDIWINGLVRAFFFVQYTNPLDIFFSPDFIFILLSIILLIIPILDYLYRSNNDRLKQYFLILILTEIVYSTYMFFYEPQSLERWAPFITVILWHNGLILRFPVFENFNFNIIKRNQEKTLILFGFGLIAGFILDTNLLTDISIFSKDIFLIMNILVLILFLIIIFSSSSNRSTNFPVIALIFLLVLGFFAYFWLSRVFFSLLSCQASQAGWC